MRAARRGRSAAAGVRPPREYEFRATPDAASCRRASWKSCRHSAVVRVRSAGGSERPTEGRATWRIRKPPPLNREGATVVRRSCGAREQAAEALARGADDAAVTRADTRRHTSSRCAWCRGEGRRGVGAALPSMTSPSRWGGRRRRLATSHHRRAATSHHRRAAAPPKYPPKANRKACMWPLKKAQGVPGAARS